jgi:hypothetical protein
MLHRITGLFACLVLAVALGTSVGCTPKVGSSGSSPSGSVSGFPFVKVGGNYSFASFVVGQVERDLGNGWIVVKGHNETSFVNLNATPSLHEISGGG